MLAVIINCKGKQYMAVRKSVKISPTSALNRKVTLSVKHLLAVAALFAAVGVYVVTQSLAASPSKIIQLNGPSTVSQGSPWTLSAGGFKPNVSYNINVLAGNYVEGGNYTSTAYYSTADSSGFLTVTGTADLPGEYKITVSEIIMQAGNKRSRAVTAGVGEFAVE